MILPGLDGTSILEPQPSQLCSTTQESQHTPWSRQYDLSAYWLWNRILERYTQLHRGIIPPRSAAMIPRPLGSQTLALDLCLTSPKVSYPLDLPAQSYGLLVSTNRKYQKNTFQNLCKTYAFLFQISFKEPFWNHFENHLKGITKHHAKCCIESHDKNHKALYFFSKFFGKPFPKTYSIYFLKAPWKPLEISYQDQLKTQPR